MSQELDTISATTEQRMQEVKSYLYEPTPEELDVEKVMEEALRLVSLSQCDVNLKSNPDIPTVLACRRDLLDAFSNILRNAHQAMRDVSKKEIGIEIMPWQDKEKHMWVLIEVADTGHGIKPSDIEKIWGLSFSTKHVSGGFGLYLVRNAIERSRGVIEVQSEINAGTKFTIKLPAFEAENE
jgi:signal transduction histidine kinase